MNSTFEPILDSHGGTPYTFAETRSESQVAILEPNLSDHHYNGVNVSRCPCCTGVAVSWILGSVTGRTINNNSNNNDDDDDK